MLQQRLPHPLLGTIHFVHASPKNSRDSQPTSKACVRSAALEAMLQQRLPLIGNVKLYKSLNSLASIAPQLIIF